MCVCRKQNNGQYQRPELIPLVLSALTYFLSFMCCCYYKIWWQLSRACRFLSNKLAWGMYEVTKVVSYIVWDFKFSRRRVLSTINLHGSTTQKTALNSFLYYFYYAELHMRIVKLHAKYRMKTDMYSGLLLFRFSCIFFLSQNLDVKKIVLSIW
jgi:hypothetical protein